MPKRRLLVADESTVSVSQLTRQLQTPVGRSVGWLVGERVYGLFANALMALILIRGLGPSEFGVFSFAVALTAIAGSVTQLSGPLMVQQLTIHPDRRPQLLASAGAITAALSALAVAALTVIVSLFGPDDSSTLLVPVLAMGLALHPILVLDFEYQAELLARRASLSRNAGLTVSVFALIAASLSGAGLLWFALARLSGSVVTAALLYALRPHRERVPIQAERTAIRSLAKKSFPLMVSAFAIGIYFKLDQVMLGWMTTAAETGRYAATARLSELFHFLPMAFAASLGPKIAEIREADRERYTDVFGRVFCYLSAVAIGIIVLTQLFGERLALKALGSAYEGVGPILSVHIFATLFVFLGIGAALWTVNENLERVFMYATVMGAIVNAALNYLLIPRFGGVGAAWATLTAYGVAAVGVNGLFKETRPLLAMQLRSLLPLRWIAAVKVDLGGPRE